VGFVENLILFPLVQKPENQLTFDKVIANYVLAFFL